MDWVPRPSAHAAPWRRPYAARGADTARISGAKGRDKRPAFAQMLKDAGRRAPS